MVNQNSSRGKSVEILDTTLRDGMQTPGIGCNLEKRMKIAKEIAKLNPNIMEIGMPANPVDFEMIPKIADAIYKVNPEIKVGILARCNDQDINKTKEVFEKIKNPKHIHLFMPTSVHLMKHSINKGKDEVINAVSEFTKKSLEVTDSVQFTPEDGAATFDRDFLMQVYRSSYAAGCRFFNVADTTGWSSTENFVSLVNDLKDEFYGIKLSCHCHNDSGLAVANSVAGVIKGVTQVEGTVLGIGERAGNVDWMSVVCTLNQIHSVNSDVNFKDFYPVAGNVGELVGVARPFCYPVVGVNSHRTSSGIHSKAVIGNSKSYHKLPPEEVGAKLELVIGQTSGKHVIESKLNEFNLVSSNLNETIKQVLNHCMENKTISKEELARYC